MVRAWEVGCGAALVLEERSREWAQVAVAFFLEIEEVGSLLDSLPTPSRAQ